MAFGKPGRPKEDRQLRQREIYRAVGPLILADGARKLSMRDAARAACLSVGGLYHYFPTKRELVLHGLDDDARERLCREQRLRFGELEGLTFKQRVEVFLDLAVELAFGFLQPAVLAALELGNGTLQERLDAGLSDHVDELTEGLRALLPGMPPSDHETLGRAIRRTTLGLLVDRNVQPDELRRQLRVLIVGTVQGAEPLEMVARV
jgi:AcrR family transcriptional regulator